MSAERAGLVMVVVLGFGEWVDWRDGGGVDIYDLYT